jgi:hypothetical protein
VPPTHHRIHEVSAYLDSLYTLWRVRCGAVSVLQEDRDSPPERLLQAVWLHQRLRRDQLRTLDGQPVQIFHPGFHNLEGGPDFRGALIQIGNAPPRSGDVEVDLCSSGWRAHGHDRNPAFANVILQVVWDSEKAVEGAPPVILMRTVLDAPLGELSLWLGGEAGFCFPEELRGRCCAALRLLPGARLRELLHQAAHVRLRSKAGQFHARAKQAGWEQSLREGLFRGLGYKHNVWPMQRLAELHPRWSTSASSSLTIQVRLLGLSGLLPAELSGRHNSADAYLRRVWDQWWRERDEFSEGVLPPGIWRLHGLRPANNPHRRLALGAAWSVMSDLTARLEHWCRQEVGQNSLGSSLMRALRVEHDDFWSWHWTLHSRRLKRAQPLLGKNRETDLAMNVVLPWLWSRASEGKNESVQQRLEQRYFAWPAAQDNSVLRLARERLLGGASHKTLGGAATQQGLLQIVRDFCDHAQPTCQGCEFPELVQEIAVAR